MPKRPWSLLAIAGTRPEVLKLAPVIRELREARGPLAVKTCFSGQHQEILRSVLGDLDVQADVELSGPPPKSSLSTSLAHLLATLGAILDELKPVGVLVQGDTSTVLAGALAAFHHQIAVFHVEAGLRTADPFLPFPEEMNRRLVARLATLHFAPTPGARQALLNEGVAAAAIEVTGNTAIDALRLYAQRPSPEAAAILARCRPESRKLLLTLHRRENRAHVGSVARAVRDVLAAHLDVEVLWILHHNGTRQRVIDALHDVPRVHLLEPQGYGSFVQLMQAATLILSDSGGVQEEAPSLGRPVLVLRDDTERPEAIAAGASRLVGCDRVRIVAACGELLSDQAIFRAMSVPRQLYGDGYASRRIRLALERHFLRVPARVAG